MLVTTPFSAHFFLFRSSISWGWIVFVIWGTDNFCVPSTTWGAAVVVISESSLQIIILCLDFVICLVILPLQIKLIRAEFVFPYTRILQRTARKESIVPNLNLSYSSDIYGGLLTNCTTYFGKKQLAVNVCLNGPLLLPNKEFSKAV